LYLNVSKNLGNFFVCKRFEKLYLGKKKVLKKNRYLDTKRYKIYIGDFFTIIFVAYASQLAARRRMGRR